MFQCTALWHEVHSHCCTTITAVLTQTFLTSPEGSSVPMKHEFLVYFPRCLRAAELLGLIVVFGAVF